MNTLITLPIKPTQIACIMDDKNGTQYIYICNAKCLVQKTTEDPHKPSKFIATIQISDIAKAIKYMAKLNAKGIEYYKAHY
ncbi:hypothetical protein CZP2022_15 [Vibrio phage C-ZP2022]|nr:hypothetical protein CZP2022_15 [Vibrio phage C-ZP2022]